MICDAREGGFNPLGMDFLDSPFLTTCTALDGKIYSNDRIEFSILKCFEPSKLR